MGKFWEYLKAVFSRWEPAMGGVGAALLIWLLGWLYEQRNGAGTGTLPWYYYIFVALGFVFYSGYCEWRDKDQRLQEARQWLAALKTQLEDHLDDSLQEVVFGKYSGLTPFAKLAHLQTRSHYLWIDLERAEPERKPILVHKLERTLRQQLALEAFQRPSAEGQKQFYEIVSGIERLKAIAKSLQLPDIG